MQPQSILKKSISIPKDYTSIKCIKIRLLLLPIMHLNLKPDHKVFVPLLLHSLIIPLINEANKKWCPM